MVNLCALFVILLLHRHQNLMKSNSKMKLGRKTICGKIFTFPQPFHYYVSVFSALLLLGSNSLPIRYASISITDSAQQATILRQVISLFDECVGEFNFLLQRCTDCDWIERERNYGVLSEYDAAVRVLHIISISEISVSQFHQ